MNLIAELKKKADRNDYENNVRINISHQEFLNLLEIIEKSKESAESLLSEMNERLSIVQKNNFKKNLAAQSATDVRVKKAEKHIKDAIDYLKRNDLKVNQNTIAKTSKCSINTVRKYKYLFEEKKIEVVPVVINSRTEKAMKKIQDAVEYLKSNDLEINQSSVIKQSKCSAATVKKYKSLFD